MCTSDGFYAAGQALGKIDKMLFACWEPVGSTDKKCETPVEVKEQDTCIPLWGKCDFSEGADPCCEGSWCDVMG